MRESGRRNARRVSGARGDFRRRTSTAAETAASSSSTSEARTTRPRRPAWGGDDERDIVVRFHISCETTEGVYPEWMASGARGCEHRATPIGTHRARKRRQMVHSVVNLTSAGSDTHLERRLGQASAGGGARATHGDASAVRELALARFRPGERHHPAGGDRADGSHRERVDSTENFEPLSAAR